MIAPLFEQSSSDFVSDFAYLLAYLLFWVLRSSVGLVARDMLPAGSRGAFVGICSHGIIALARTLSNHAPEGVLRVIHTHETRTCANRKLIDT